MDPDWVDVFPIKMGIFQPAMWSFTRGYIHSAHRQKVALLLLGRSLTNFALLAGADSRGAGYFFEGQIVIAKVWMTCICVNMCEWHLQIIASPIQSLHLGPYCVYQCVCAISKMVDALWKERCRWALNQVLLENPELFHYGSVMISKCSKYGVCIIPG